MLSRAHTHTCTPAIVCVLTPLSRSLSLCLDFLSLAITLIYAELKNDSFSLFRAKLCSISPCWSSQTFQVWLQRDLKFRVWVFSPRFLLFWRGKKASPSCYFQLLTM